MVKRKRVALKEGDIVRIDLGDGTHAYSRVLREPLMAFYDLRSHEDPEPDTIIEHRVLFKIWVMKSAVTSGRWPVVGHIDLESELKKREWFCKKDSINGSLTRYSEGEELPATFDDCKSLERAAVWDPEHVEDRLRDHFAGRPNKWVESLRISAPR